MKTKLNILLVVLCAGILSVSAQDKKKKKETVTYLVSMTCENCQQRIEKNIAFEKGVTDLKVDLPAKTVTIEYRSDKTNPQTLKEAFQKLGFTATPFHPKTKDESGGGSKEHK